MKIVVSGYYGFGNAGDEALLEALLGELRLLRPDAHFVVLSRNPADTARRYGVESVSRTNVRQIASSLQDADLFISGGGSLLQDATSARTVPYYVGLIELARRFGVPICVYAQGLGPLRRPFLRRLAARGLQKADIVTVRDEVSAQEAVSFGVAPNKLLLTADPVFALARTDAVASRHATGATRTPTDRLDGLKGTLSEAGRQVLAALPNEPLVGVSLRPLVGRGPQGELLNRRLVDVVAARLTELLPRFGAKVLPLPLYGAQDGLLSQNVASALGSAAVPWPAAIAPERLHAHDWLSLMTHLKLCVTMRLHGLIFAAVAGLPFIGLSDDPKVDAHVAALNVDAAKTLISAKSVLHDDGQALAAMLAAVWDTRCEISNRLQQRVPFLAERARQTAAAAIALASKKEASASPRQTYPPPRLRASVLGTPVDGVTMKQAVAHARRYIAERRRAHIVTANPELVMQARQDPKVRAMLDHADLVVPDGIGVVAAASLLGTPVPERVPGVELMQALLAEAGKNEWKIYLLGGAPGVAQEAARRIVDRWPGVRIVGTRNGYFRADEEAAIVADICATAPDVLFVGMGAPRQELFIARWREADDGEWNVPLAVGIGGSIDVLAGKVRRAPAVWQKLGIEWLYRLLRQPSRLRRTMVLPKFAFLVLFHALRRNLL